ncbi:response regulator transcription factor [Natronincola ferrireducens]|uniref:Stage 0 sporulation protein A homolog n=1 Tax=Natronincola ferrireducens TaxID=393762 RepID=A0A1G8YRX9_9FIRM|nr:response regulator [Natronincola ferrireducens]SDK05184.1 two-component system, response regulator YesN [Natronincola ferrireducens]
MNRLLIVDDELIIRTGLVNKIKWKEIGIDEVYSSTNGVEALKAIKKVKPNIICTDIKMPKMNGIELIKNIRQQNLDVEIVIYSGYGEFRYAQEALKNNVDNYILKPTKIEKITDIFIEIVKKISLKEKQEKKIQQLQEAYEKYINLIENLTSISDFRKIITNETNNNFDLLNSLESIDKIETYENYWDKIMGDEAKITDEFNQQILMASKHAIYTAKKYIKANYNKNISLNDVAKEVYMNPSYFSHIFKQETGTNYINYLTNLRLKQAKHLLKYTKAPIYQISDEIGYKNSKYFNKLFKKHIGLTPSQFREAPRDISMPLK